MKKIVNGNVVDMDASEFAALGAKSRADYARLVREKAKSLRDGGTVINGMAIATDVDARTRLLGAKVNPKESRKVVAKGGRAIMTGAQLNAIVDGIDAFLQSVDDKEYDCLELIDATADADLSTLDLETGWPE